MMNKIIIRNISLSLMLLIILVLVVMLRDRSPFGKTQSSFASEPKKEITDIEFSEGGKKLVLAKQKNVWIINGNHEARISAIDYITRILTEIKIKSPLSPDLFRTEIIEKKVTPVKVKVYEKRKLLKSFLVYKTGSNKYGNVMKMNGKSKPFIVYVPGFEGDIGSGFTINELFWQPYTLFNLLPSEISSVTFENITDPSSSFEIINKSNKYTLSDTHNQLSGWDTAQIKRYISYFTWIPFETWAFDLPETERQKIESEQPLFRIMVKKNEGREIVLLLWERKDEKSGSTDSDRLWGSIGGNNALFVIRYFDIDPIIKKRSYFFP